MNHETFTKFTSDTFAECDAIMNSKGPDYSGTIDRLANFKDSGRDAGISPSQSCFNYMLKHWYALRKYVRGEVLTGEGVEEKLKDLINYCVLLLALIHENKTQGLQAKDTTGEYYQNSTVVHDLRDKDVLDALGITQKQNEKEKDRTG